MRHGSLRARETNRFGLHEADLQERVLTTGGLRVRLQDQPFQVLAVLLERPGEVITRLGALLFSQEDLPRSQQTLEEAAAFPVAVVLGNIHTQLFFREHSNWPRWFSSS